MKGIVLAGGTGSRLHPVTQVVNKQLLPVYDKPMIYYPLSTLMLAGIRDILIISTPAAQPVFQAQLGDGTAFGLNLRYAVQDQPNGLPEAFIIGRDFIAGEPVAMVLGDNLFFGHGLTDVLESAAALTRGGRVFAYAVSDPQRYGVVDFDAEGRVRALVEKPETPPSNWALTGLYFFDERVSDIAAGLAPSARGELEMVDIMEDYMARGELGVEKLGRGYAWLDTGTHESLLQAALYVQTIEQRQGLKIACLEEIALRRGFIDLPTFEAAAARLASSSYGEYLATIVREFRNPL